MLLLSPNLPEAGCKHELWNDKLGIFHKCRCVTLQWNLPFSDVECNTACISIHQAKHEVCGIVNLTLSVRLCLLIVSDDFCSNPILFFFHDYGWPALFCLFLSARRCAKLMRGDGLAESLCVIIREIKEVFKLIITEIRLGWCLNM